MTLNNLNTLSMIEQNLAHPQRLAACSREHINKRSIYSTFGQVHGPWLMLGLKIISRYKWLRIAVPIVAFLAFALTTPMILSDLAEGSSSEWLKKPLVSFSIVVAFSMLMSGLMTLLFWKKTTRDRKEVLDYHISQAGAERALNLSWIFSKIGLIRKPITLNSPVIQVAQAIGNHMSALAKEFIKTERKKVKFYTVIRLALTDRLLGTSMKRMRALHQANPNLVPAPEFFIGAVTSGYTDASIVHHIINHIEIYAERGAGEWDAIEL